MVCDYIGLFGWAEIAAGSKILRHLPSINAVEISINLFL
jgi:hypothetical protein